MKKYLLYSILTALIGWSMAACSNSEENTVPNTEAQITSIDLKDANGQSVLLQSDIDAEKLTIRALVKEGTDLEHLRLEPVVSNKAVVKPVAGMLMSFTIPTRIEVISEDGRLTNNWFIIVREARPSDANLLSVEDVTTKNGVSVLVASEIDTEMKELKVVVKERADRTALKLNVSISEGATIAPSLDMLTDFTKGGVSYTITSENKKTVNKWKITVVPEEFIDVDTGKDYKPNAAEWTLDKDRSDAFDGWNAAQWTTFSEGMAGAFRYNGDNAFVKDGKLRITADVNAGTYSTGKVKSTIEIGNNTYLNIRAKATNVQALVNSYIKLQNENGDAFPVSLMEVVGGGAFGKYTSSLSRNGVLVASRETSVGETRLNDDYHVYGFERRNECIRFFFDGKEVWAFEMNEYPELSNQKLSLVIGIDGKEGVEQNDSKLPAYLLVDYVEVYNAVHTGVLIPTDGNNLVKNYSFESTVGGDGKADGWTFTKNPSSATAVFWCYRDDEGVGDNPDNHSRLGVALKSPLEYTVSQTISNLENGLYRVEVWGYVQDSSAKFKSLPRLFVKGYGGSEQTVEFPKSALGPEKWKATGVNPWRKVAIGNIYISSGTCEIGVQAVSSAATARFFLDGFKLVKVIYKSK